MVANYIKILNEVKNNRFSGAWVVAQQAIKCLESLIKEKSDLSLEELRSEIEKVAKEILQSQPGMAQLTNLFNTVLDTIHDTCATDPIVILRKLSGEIRRFHENCTNAVARVAEYGAKLIEEDDQVFIHSNSSTIMEILRIAFKSGTTFQVILTESRPIMEGRTCATELANLGITCSYLVDAGAAKGIERADLVLLGADSLSEVSLVNKIGSKAICLLASEQVVPCYAACESSKFIPQALGPRKEQPRNPDEVWSNPPAETTAENYYFDEVSLQLFNGIITEAGILTPEEIGGRILSQKMNKRIFEMLR